MRALDDSLYRELILSSHIAYCVTDKDQKIQLVNPAFTRLYGYESEDLEDRTPDVLNPGKAVYFENGVYQGEYDRLMAGIRAFINSDDPTHWEGRVLNKRKDGSLVWVRLRLSTIRDENGEVTAFLWATENVTEELEADLQIRMEIYHAITDLAETRDNETGNHLKRIASYTSIVASQLGMPSAFVKQIELFSPLHDIGKVGIPDKILLAPRKLDAEEYEIMKTHTDLGFRILTGRQTLEMAADIAHFHHERYDGTGYPEGIAGGAIPIAARITALADVYDALTSDRPYKSAWSHEDATALITEEKGKHFDPLVVEAFSAQQQEFASVRRRIRDGDGSTATTAEDTVVP